MATTSIRLGKARTGSSPTDKSTEKARVGVCIFTCVIPESSFEGGRGLARELQ